MAHVEYEMLLRLSNKECAAGSYICETGAPRRDLGQRHRLGKHPHSLQSKENGRPKSWSDPGRHQQLKGPPKRFKNNARKVDIGEFQVRGVADPCKAK